MKFKICPACDFHNVSFAEKCKKCGCDIKGMPVYEKPSPAPETVQEHMAKKFLFSLAILVVVILIYFIFFT